MINSVQTFQEIINAALKAPQDAVYGINKEVHTLPFCENEKPRAIKAVAGKKPPPDHHIIMGFGGLFTFDLAVASDPPPVGILLCDINSDQAVFWGAFLQLVEECGTAMELRQRFSALPNERTDIKFRLPKRVKTTETINHYDGENAIEWIWDEKKYEKIRTMALEGKIAYITLDCMDERRYEAIKKTLGDDFSISTLYLSNIYKFHNKGFYKGQVRLSQSDIVEKFWENQLSLCNDETLIMSAEPNGRFGDDIHLYTPQKIKERFLNRGLIA